MASSSIAHHFPLYEQLLLMKIEFWKTLVARRNEVNPLLSQTAERFFREEIEILCSIPGIGKQSAIYFLSEIVDIRRFDGWRKLIGFCGLDPVIKQAGNYSGRCKLSKRGNSHARRVVFIMASCVKRSCPYFTAYYRKKREEGKSYIEAVVATSTKLLRTIFALLKEKRRFI